MHLYITRDGIYHIVLLWVSSHAFHSIPLSIFRQSIGKFLSCSRLGPIENNNVLALVTKQASKRSRYDHSLSVTLLHI